jgi:repressor LexA
MNAPSAAQHLKALETKGAIIRDPGKGRGIKIVAFNGTSEPVFVRDDNGDLPAINPDGGLRLQLVGSIPAGLPQASADDNSQHYIDISAAWFGRGRMVAARVRGESMAGDAICDGDMAIIRLQQDATPQDIVAVRVTDGEVTLKRVRHCGKSVELLPSNPEFPVQVYAADSVEIVGKLVGLIRRDLHH